MARRSGSTPRRRSDVVEGWSQKDRQRVEQLLQYIQEVLPDLGNASLCDEDFYASLPLCVIDAVFSIGVRYEGTKRVVRNWCEAQKPQWKRIDRTPERPTDAPTVSEFLRITNGVSSDVLAGRDFFDNRQRTSTRHGILKAEAARRFAMGLSWHRIETFDDLKDVQRVEAARSEILKIPGQRSGLSFDYFLMLAGSDEIVKVDRMICQFVTDALKTSVPRDTTYRLVVEACNKLKTSFPHLTPRLLDNSIWKFQRKRRSTKPSGVGLKIRSM